jgi:ADP-ribosylglycohydrolase
MLGAILGDMIGSVYEGSRSKTKEFPLFDSHSIFTDDTVLSVAVAEWLLTGQDLAELLRAYYADYPGRGYGGMFHAWACRKRTGPYNSYGNGAAMRVSPVGFAFDTLDDVLAWAEQSAAVTHNHPEGIRGAQAAAAAIYFARRIRDKDEIQRLLAAQFGYDLATPLDRIRPDYGFEVSCQGTVPPAIRAFLEATDYEDAIRNAISLGGDADTLACITGGIAEAYYGVPAELEAIAWQLLDAKLAAVVARFRRQHGLGPRGA